MASLHSKRDLIQTSRSLLPIIQTSTSKRRLSSRSKSLSFLSVLTLLNHQVLSNGRASRKQRAMLNLLQSTTTPWQIYQSRTDNAPRWINPYSQPKVQWKLNRPWRTSKRSTITLPLKTPLSSNVSVFRCILNNQLRNKKASMKMFLQITRAEMLTVQWNSRMWRPSSLTPWTMQILTVIASLNRYFHRWKNKDHPLLTGLTPVGRVNTSSTLVFSRSLPSKRLEAWVPRLTLCLSIIRPSF